jgi:hypothetical protein
LRLVTTSSARWPTSSSCILQGMAPSISCDAQRGLTGNARLLGGDTRLPHLTRLAGSAGLSQGRNSMKASAAQCAQP